MHDRYVFDELDIFERRLRRAAADIAYLVLWDRTDRRAEENLGRFELTARDALPYLEGADELSEDDERAPLDLDDDPEDALARALGRAPGPADYAVAAGRWMRDIAARNLGGDACRRFRVRAYGPKGARVVDTTSFSCRNDEHEPELPALPTSLTLEPREASPGEQVEVAAAARGMRALGEYYAQWGQLVLGSVGQLQGVNNAMLARLHRQLDQSREQVDQLVATVLNARVSEVEAAEQRRLTERGEEARTELARTALVQLGDAARAFVATRDAPAEVVDAVGLLGRSPELMAALHDPDVRALLADPTHLQVLAGMLRQFAAQARAHAQPA